MFGREIEEESDSSPPHLRVQRLLRRLTVATTWHWAPVAAGHDLVRSGERGCGSAKHMSPEHRHRGAVLSIMMMILTRES